LKLLLAFAVAGLAMLPVLWPYHVVSKLYDMRRGAGEVMLSSAEWHDWLVAASRSRLYGWAVDPHLSSPERALFPGMMALLLLIAAFAYKAPGIGSQALEEVPRDLGPVTRHPSPLP